MMKIPNPRLAKDRLQCFDKVKTIVMQLLLSIGTMIPKSGGDYAYIHEAFGPLPAFLYLWAALLVIMPAGNAITALTFANYILQPFWPECDPPLNAVRLIAAAVVCKQGGFYTRRVFRI